MFTPEATSRMIATLRALGVAVVRARGLVWNERNVHWLIHTDSGSAICTRMSAGRSLDEVRYMIAVMEGFRARGWPVPEILHEPAIADGNVWLVAERRPGTPQGAQIDALSPESQRGIGRLIARFQTDGAALVELGQRPGERDGIPDVATFFARTPTHDETFARWSERLPEEMGILRRYAVLTIELLEPFARRTLPSIVVHGDLTPWNLLYEGNELTGVVDFEFAHLNHRIADLVLTWRGRHDDIVHGYREVAPLSAEEFELLTPLRWAWLLDGARASLLRADESETHPDLSWTMRQIVRRTPLTTADV